MLFLIELNKIYCSLFLTICLCIWDYCLLTSKSCERTQKNFGYPFQQFKYCLDFNIKSLDCYFFFFFFSNITAVGSFNFICMKQKLYQAFFMCWRISDKTSFWEVMHTILSRNSVEQNCSCSFPFWLVSHWLHHYIINFFVLAILHSRTTSFPPFFHSLSLLVLCF